MPQHFFRYRILKHYMKIDAQVGKLERGLELAHKLQNRILFEDFDLEKSLHVFLTISKSLNRTEDAEWAQNELLGFPDSKIPLYRNIVCSIQHDNKTIKLKNGYTFTDHLITLPYPKLKNIVDTLDEYYMLYAPTPVDLKYFNKKTNEKLSDNISILYTKADLSVLFTGIKLEIINRLDDIINKIIYDVIPQDIFKEFQNVVQKKLVDLKSDAINALNIAIENLGDSENPEKTAVVALECRRLIKIIADHLSKSGKYYVLDGNNIPIGPNDSINRLRAYVDQKDKKIKVPLQNKLDLLSQLYSKIPESINKGIHANISNSTAKMLVIYNYIILGEIIKTKPNLINEHPK